MNAPAELTKLIPGYGHQVSDTEFLQYANELAEDTGISVQRISDDEIQCVITPDTNSEEAECFSSIPSVYRLPSAVTKEWLASITHVSENTLRHYPMMTPENIADNLIKHGDHNMIAAVRSINIGFGREECIQMGLRPAFNGAVLGYSVPDTASVYVNADDVAISFWNSLVHEIRHIGLMCNPIISWMYPENSNDEDVVSDYATKASFKYDWDDLTK